MKLLPRKWLTCILLATMTAFSLPLGAQERLPWERGAGGSSADGGRTYQEPGEAYDPARHGGGSRNDYDRGYDALRNNRGSSNYDPRPYDEVPAQEQVQQPRYEQQPRYRQEPRYEQPRNEQPRAQQQPRYDEQPRYRQQPRYEPEPRYDGQSRYREGPRYEQPGVRQQPRYQPPAAQGPGRPYAAPGQALPPHNQGATPMPLEDGTYSDNEILNAGHRFFGKTTKGLAKMLNHLFKSEGRPTAYILGEEGGGAFIAGLRYGEGTIYTKWGERRKVYWQGPSIGYDFGANGAKTMILVYKLRNIDDIFRRYAGVEGSAYLVGGVAVTLQKRDNITLAPIRTGVGVRLGANVGYLKYTRRPTWNPF